MHASTAFFLALAGSAVAQVSPTSSALTSSPSSSSGCGTQIDNIIASCLSSTQAQLNACATNDWDCYCTQQTNVLTCYNNCPSDPRRSPAEGQQTSWCNAAHPYGTTTTSAASTTQTPSGSSSDSSSGASPTGSTTTNDESPASSSSGSAASPTSTDNAAPANVVPGALVAFLGLAVLL